jgi:hypothetical protein
MFRDYLKSFLDNIRNRVSNPFIGAYSLSFIIYNWKSFFIVILSGLSIEDRINYVENNYTTVWTFLVPLFMAGVYLLLMPWLNIFLDWVVGRAQSKIHSKYHTDKTNKLKNEVELARLEFEIQDARSGARDRSDLIDQVESLKSKVQSQHDELKNLSSRNEERIALKEAEINKLLQEVNKQSAINFDLNKELSGRFLNRDILDKATKYLSGLNPIVLHSLLKLYPNSMRSEDIKNEIPTFYLMVEDLKFNSIIEWQSIDKETRYKLSAYGALALRIIYDDFDIKF